MLRLRLFHPQALAEIIGLCTLIPVMELILALTLDPQGEAQLEAGIAALWLALFLSATTVMPLILREDMEDRGYELYLLARKLDRYFLSTVMASTFIILFFSAIALSTAHLFFSLPLAGLGLKGYLSPALFALGHSSLSFLLHWITARIRAGAFLFHLFGYLFFLPLVLSGVEIYRSTFVPAPVEAHPWFTLLLFFVLLYFLFGYLLCPYLLRE